MAITRVQQGQISASIEYAADLGVGSGLLNRATLAEDLNALRSLLVDAKGTTNWYDGVSQSLEDLSTAIIVDGTGAQVQGAFVASGSATFGYFGAAGSVTVEDTSGTDQIVLDGASGNVSLSGSLWVSGSSTQIGLATFENGISVSGGGIDIAGDKLEITGTFGVSGSSALDGNLYLTGEAGLSSSLTVEGPATFNGLVDANNGLSASGLFVDNLTATRVVFVDAGGQLVDSSNLTFTNSAFSVYAGEFNVDSSGNATVGGGLYVDADLTVNGNDIKSSTGATAITLSGSDVVVAGDLQVIGNDISSSTGDKAIKLSGVDVEVSGDLKVTGNDIKSSTSATAITLSGSDVEVSGVLKVTGNDIKSSAGTTAITLSGSDVEVSGDLQVKGNDIKNGDGDTVITFVGLNIQVPADLRVGGDLIVTGTMTYIETENLKIKDAIIHLATGSNTAESRGLVLHGGSGSGGDLGFGAKQNGYEFVFAKEVSDANVDSTNSEIFNGAQLAGVWLNGASLGGVEGTLSGSLAAQAAAGTVKLSAAADLKLEAGSELFSLASAGEQTDFDTRFPTSTLVGALNTLFDSVAGGAVAKDTYTSADFAGDVLDFSAQAILPSADHKLVDVYLNGVLMAPAFDLVAIATGSVTFDNAIVTELVAQDVITIITRASV